MSPKKNAFIVFVNQYRDEEIKKGNKVPNFQELIVKLTPSWNSMSEDEKNNYKILAKKYNSIKTDNNKSPEIDLLLNNSSDYWKMQQQLITMFENISESEILKEKFLLLHVNCHAHDGEKYYFPAEIAVLEFNLLNGSSRIYHQIIGISESYPRGLAGGLREYSDKFHQISFYDKHPDNYKNILMNLLKFLNNKITDNNDFNNPTFNLPYLYTVETDIGIDMMKVRSSLNNLYNKVFPNDNSKHTSLFKIGSIERLFHEITKKLNLHLDRRSIRAGMSVSNILESEMYGHGLGCVYHETKDIAFKCSKARVIQWMSNICKHISNLNGLTLTPGKHTAILLRDGSRMDPFPFKKELTDEEKFYLLSPLKNMKNKFN